MIKELTVTDIRFRSLYCHLLYNDELVAILTTQEVFEMVDKGKNFIETKLDMGMSKPVKLIFSGDLICSIKDVGSSSSSAVSSIEFDTDYSTLFLKQKVGTTIIVSNSELYAMLDKGLCSIETLIESREISISFEEFQLLQIKAYRNRKSHSLEGINYTNLGMMKILCFRGRELYYNTTESEDGFICRVENIDLSGWDYVSRIDLVFNSQEGKTFLVSISPDTVGKIRIWKSFHAQ